MNIGSVSTYIARNDVYANHYPTNGQNSNAARSEIANRNRENQAKMEQKYAEVVRQEKAATDRAASADRQAQAAAFGSSSAMLGLGAFIFPPIFGISAAMQGAIGLLGSLLGGMAIKFPDVFGAMGKFLSGAADTAKNVVSDAADGVKKAAEDVGDAAKKTVEKAVDAAGDAAKSVGKAISSLF
ncbi:MAG: hypothetical protein U0527_11955 [Candidatus Eisenbacteria bacterium]